MEVVQVRDDVDFSQRGSTGDEEPGWTIDILCRWSSMGGGRRGEAGVAPYFLLRATQRTGMGNTRMDLWSEGKNSF